MLCRRTLAPARTASVESVMVPCTRPRYSCAFAASARNTPSSKKRAVRSQIDFIGIPPSSQRRCHRSLAPVCPRQERRTPINPNSAPLWHDRVHNLRLKSILECGGEQKGFLELVCTLRHSSLQFVEEIQ